MKFVRSRPFLCLAVLTVLLGALWHSPLVSEPGLRASLDGTMRVVGAPFIAGMRVAGGIFGHSAITPLVGLLLGVAPYLLADWLYRRRRSWARVKPSG